jgi:hypothetical protein
MTILHITLEQIEQMFDNQYNQLRLENNAGLDPDALRNAKRQVLMYWHKLQDIVARKVTATEVQLSSLGERTTEDETGIPFVIHGVVDVVQTGDEVILYDIKTYSRENIEKNADTREYFTNQLNVYAYIWQKLYNQKVSKTCIIATELPEDLLALPTNADWQNDPAYIDWDPIVEVPFDQTKMEATLGKFRSVVKDINERKFIPLDSGIIRSQWQQRGVQMVCRKCDARFSCDAYREFANDPKSPVRKALAVYLDSPPTQAARKMPTKKVSVFQYVVDELDYDNGRDENEIEDGLQAATIYLDDNA